MRRHAHDHDPHGGRHVPLEGVIHQPVDPTTTRPDLPPTVTPWSGRLPSDGVPTVVVVQPDHQPPSGLGPIGGRLILGAGIGAGAVLAIALVGSLLLATLQALAMTALAIGGMALALAVAAAALARALKG